MGSSPSRHTSPTERWSPTTRAASAAAPAATAAPTTTPRSRPRTSMPSSSRLDAGPVELFASSGGAVTAFALVAAHPDDVTTARGARAADDRRAPRRRASPRGAARLPGRLQRKGSGAGMAAFIAMSSWQGEFTDEYPPSRRPIRPSSACRPTTTGPVATRCCPMCRSDHGLPARRRRAERRAHPRGGRRRHRVEGVFTGRTAMATAEALGQEATVFPSHHGGFMGGESATPASRRRSRRSCARSGRRIGE